MSDVKIELRQYAPTAAALKKLGVEVVDQIEPIIAEYAETIKNESKTRLASTHSPSGLFKKLHGTPRYTVKKKSPFYYKVSTPSRPWGYAAALYETAEKAHSKQGKTLIAIFNSWGGKTNRIMYRVFDERHAEFAAKFDAAVRKAAEKIDKETS